MGYFDDLQVCAAVRIPRCQASLDRDFPDSWSLEYLHAGRISWGMDGQAPVIIDRPAVFWHLPGHRYRYGALDRRGWDHHYLLMQGIRAVRIVEALQSSNPAGWMPIHDPGPIHDLMRQAIGWANQDHRHPELVAVIETIAARCLSVPMHGPQHARILALADRIRARPLLPWSTATLARSAGCSEIHMRRLFRTCIGCSPSAWIVTARMHLAQRALVDGRSVREAGALAGYADPAHFSRMFRRCVGVAPRTWQQRLHPGDPRLSVP